MQTVNMTSRDDMVIIKTPVGNVVVGFDMFAGNKHIYITPEEGSKIKQTRNLPKDNNTIILVMP